MQLDAANYAFAVAGKGLRPLLLGAGDAHRSGTVSYEGNGTLLIQHTAVGSIRIPPDRQFPCVRATFDDLNKALSRLANSPHVEEGTTLRESYENEVARYEQLVAAAYAEGRFEPDYGSYVFDPRQNEIYLIAPEPWHKLALVASNSTLLTDPEWKLAWREVRQRLATAVVGFAGVSVGGNVLEGWLREARPRQIKLADPDWVELTNFNRCERLSLRHMVASRAARFDSRNPYEATRVSKAAYVAYESLLVDPYMIIHMYDEGLTRANIDRFLTGDGGKEPKLDVLVEEMDDLELKVIVRESARRHGIDVLMMSDFGHQSHLFWNPFRTHPISQLGYGATDEDLLTALAKAQCGDRNKVFEYMAAFAGNDFATDEFKCWMDGRGEHPTASLPQSGSTAMASGAIGGKELALHVLGHPLPKDNRVIYDMMRRTAREG